MEYSLTLFSNLGDSSTKKRMDFDDLQHFERFFRKSYELEYDSKADAPLITPAMYKDTSLGRLNTNVSHWARWTALDIDAWDNGDIEEYFANKLEGYKYIIYSTASSTIETPKFRLVIPTQSKIMAESIPTFWHSINKMLGRTNDKQVKDLTRIYYVPGHYKSSNNNFLYISEGENFINHNEIMIKYPYPKIRTLTEQLPKRMQRNIADHKKLELLDEGGVFYWTHYTNCPFFPTKLAEEYVNISGGGHYTKMFSIMVSICCSALKKNYPISADDVIQMCKDFDIDTGAWYTKRNWEKEAKNALEFAYKNV